MNHTRPFAQVLMALVLGTAACATHRVHQSSPSNVSSAGRSGLSVPSEHEWWLTVAGNCRLYVREVGHGPYVVVLHDGWGLEHSYLVGGFRPLAKRFRFVFYDQRGSLRSPCDSLASLDDHVDDLERLRVALGGTRMILVGHAMGAYLAASYVARHPDHVAGLALLGAAPILRSADYRSVTDDDLRPRYRRPRVEAERTKHGLDRKEPADPRLRWLQYRIAKGAVFLHKVERWTRLEGTLFFAADANHAAAASMPKEWDFTPLLAGLPFRVLVVFPDDDLWPPPPRGVPNAQIEVIRQAGHIMWIDQPEEFTSILKRYLDSVLASDGTR